MKKDYYQIAEDFYHKGEYKKAFENYRLGANDGDAACINALGYCYGEGIGVEKEPYLELEYYKKAASLGNIKAYINLGNVYGVGTYLVDVDQELSFIWYRQAALNNHSEAQFAVGLRCFNGYGTKKDLSQAIEWIEKAAHQQHPQAIEFLYTVYGGGYGFERDEEKVAFWCEKAAKIGMVDAQNNYGLRLIDEKRYEEAFYYFNEAAKKGSQLALGNMGYCYMNGLGVKKDTEKGKYYLELSGFSYFDEGENN